jgi:hypothetical protein
MFIWTRNLYTNDPESYQLSFIRHLLKGEQNYQNLHPDVSLGLGGPEV